MEGLERKTQRSWLTTVKILCCCQFCGGCEPVSTAPHRAPPSNVSVGSGPSACSSLSRLAALVGDACVTAPSMPGSRAADTASLASYLQVFLHPTSSH